MRTFLTLADTTDLTRAAFPGRRPVTMTRLPGGTVKGVYRLAFDDGFRCLVYRWHPDEDFWPAGTATGIADFLRGHELLSGVGARVPEIYAAFPDRDLALVEDVRGGSLEQVLDRDPAPLTRLGDMLARMHGDVAPGFNCAELVLEDALRALDEAAHLFPGRRAGFAAELRSRYAAVRPRTSLGVIHGELGPDHVMVADDGEPVLIDIEGARRFDVEWEHAFLELRFGSRYPVLRRVELDEARMRLYRPAQYLSLVAGPLRLLEGDFPRPEVMRDIIRWNVERTLKELADA